MPRWLLVTWALTTRKKKTKMKTKTRKKSLILREAAVKMVAGLKTT